MPQKVYSCAQFIGPVNTPVGIKAMARRDYSLKHPSLYFSVKNPKFRIFVDKAMKSQSADLTHVETLGVINTAVVLGDFHPFSKILHSLLC